MKLKTTNLSVQQQGAPKLRSKKAFILYQNDKVALLKIELKKGCFNVCAKYGSSGDKDEIGIMIEKVPYDDTKDTLVIFTEFANWDVFSVWSGTDFIDVTLVKGV
jgi:hypothetical protein